MRSTAPASVGPPGFGPANERARKAEVPPAETSRLPGMVPAVLGVLAGGALLIRAALGLPDDLWGMLDGGALAEPKLLATAGVLTAGGCFAIGRVLVARGSTDRAAVAIVLAMAIPLAAFAVVGVVSRPEQEEDRRFADPSVPFTFSYPGAWRQDPPEDLPRAGHERWVIGVSKQNEETVRQGVLIVVTESVSAGALKTWMLGSNQQGAHVAGHRRRTVAGRPALTVDYERAPGHGFRSRTGLFVGNTAFVINCVVEEDPERAQAGCDKVLDTLEIQDEGAPAGARPPSLS